MTHYRDAADQGDASAQFNLGVMYANGQGVTKDEAEAARWYRRAAEQGHAPAQYNLGLMCAQGHGVTKDEVEAVRWYRKAAEQGLSDAEYNLGFMYAQGHGVTKDEAEAVKWFGKAADQGQADVRTRLESMLVIQRGNPRIADTKFGKQDSTAEVLTSANDPLAESFGVGHEMINRVHSERERLKRLEQLPRGRVRGAMRTNTVVVLWCGVFGYFVVMGWVVIPLDRVYGLSASSHPWLLAALPHPWLVVALVIFLIWELCVDARESQKEAKWIDAAEAPPIASELELQMVDAFILEEQARDEENRKRSEASWTRWESMDGLVFEREFAQLLQQCGWNVKATKGSGDGGVDIEGTDPLGIRVAIQCKWWRNACGVATVRELKGAIAVIYGHPRPIVVCDGGFTKDATNFAKAAGVELMDGRAVRSMIEASQTKAVC